MKNEKLLKRLGDIDEKHIIEANKDVELWLEQQNGVKVTVDSTRKHSPWKIITAVSCSAAAIIGAFVLISNIPDIKNIGNTRSTVYSDGNSTQSTTLSEQLADYKITNLDYKNAVITENTPASGQWRRLSYEIPGINEKSADRLVKIAEAYGATVNRDDIVLRMWDKLGRMRLTPISEVDISKYGELQFTDMSKVPYNSMLYLSDDIYIEIVEQGYGGIDMDNRGRIGSLDNKIQNSYCYWHPSVNGKLIHFVEPGDEEDTVILDGKTVKVADAVRNAQKYISENKALFPQMFDPEITDITTYTYDNGNQVLHIQFQYNYDGMKFMSAPSNEFDEDRDSGRAYQNRFECAMLTENTVDWIKFDLFDGATEFTVEDCEVTISREDALKLVSQELDPDKMMVVKEIQLIFAERRTDGGKVSVAEPTWMIVLAKDEVWYSNKTYAYVSATDGTVGIFKDKKIGSYPTLY